MDHIAKLAISGVGRIADMAQDVYMLDDNGTAPEPAPAPSAPDPCQPGLDTALLLNGPLAYQFVAATLCLAFLVAWVRRSTNQRAVMLGFGVESALSMVHFVAILVLLRQWSACKEFPPSGTATTANGVMLVLARLGMAGTGIAAGCSQNQKLGLAFTCSCIFYFLVWFGFQIFGFEKTIADLFDAEYKELVNALARTVPGALAGIILFIQRAPASGEDGIEVP